MRVAGSQALRQVEDSRKGLPMAPIWRGLALRVIADRDVPGFDCKLDRAKNYAADGREELL
jgi:hypothetical protein